MSVAYLEHSTLARVVLDVGIGGFTAGEFSQALRRRRARAVDLRAEIVFRVMFCAGILLLALHRVVLPAATVGAAWPCVVGAAIGWSGLLLRWWAFRTLGRLFSVVLRTSHDQPVVDRGPYRVLRHPSYTGLLLAVAGCGLMLGNWASALGATCVVLVSLVYRLRIEERALSAALGCRYVEYAATRARLVPYLW